VPPCQSSFLLATILGMWGSTAAVTVSICEPRGCGGGTEQQGC
jgi:hypothetical protein